MDLKILINVIANGILCISTTGFIAILRHEKSPIETMPIWTQWWIRVSLASIAAGALFSVLRLSNPVWSEVAVNTGLAGLFSWAVSWHKYRWSIK
jgi:hypothetical protein